MKTAKIVYSVILMIIAIFLLDSILNWLDYELGLTTSLDEMSIYLQLIALKFSTVFSIVIISLIAYLIFNLYPKLVTAAVIGYILADLVWTCGLLIYNNLILEEMFPWKGLLVTFAYSISTLVLTVLIVIWIGRIFVRTANIDEKLTKPL